MRKGFTWKLDQSMRIRIQVLLLEPSSLLMILRGELAVRFHCSSDASVIGLCGYIYKKFMVVVRADAKGYRGIAFLDSFFILFASYTDSLYAGARIMEKQHSIMIFKVFFTFTIAAAAISHSILLSPDSSKATNAAASCTQHH
uniref:Uncharacterized protein n=1 Tax=Brassica oleracea TaxID=3712 RepID=A0A3P6H0H1_BRAOL|nr:unnamed protein product [Brassica oleracea]